MPVPGVGVVPVGGVLPLIGGVVPVVGVLVVGDVVDGTWPGIGSGEVGDVVLPIGSVLLLLIGSGVGVGVGVGVGLGVVRDCDVGGDFDLGLVGLVCARAMLDALNPISPRVNMIRMEIVSG